MMLGEPHFTSCLMSTIHKSQRLADLSKSSSVPLCVIIIIPKQNLLDKTLGNIILQERSSRQLYCFPSLLMGFYGLEFAPVPLGIHEDEARECIKLQKCSFVPPPPPPPPTSKFSNKNRNKLVIFSSTALCYGDNDVISQMKDYIAHIPEGTHWTLSPPILVSLVRCCNTRWWLLCPIGQHTPVS